jgi:hypothetical protein
MYQRKNFAYGTVLTPPDPATTGTSIVLNSGHGARFPNTSGGTYVCVVKQVSVPCTPENSEVVLVTSHDPANDTFTITREQESSSARTIIAGDEFYLAPTSGVWDSIFVSPTFTGTVTLPKTTEIQDTSADHQYVLAVNELTADRTVTLPLLTGNDEVVFKDHAVTMTNKTLTSPILTTPQINDTSADHQYVTAVSELTADRTITFPLLTADDTFVFRNHDNVAIKFNAPQGFLINGKIVPSVASDNLTVAIKGLDGNDPSATNPVYCRIGDTVRSITSALSMYRAAGVNYGNAGSAELATKEIDWFVYLVYDSTSSAVTVGISRIPYARLMSDFGATGQSEDGLVRTAGLTNVAGDECEVIGRFAATLSAGAGYTWTVPTFTTINLVQGPRYETRWLAWQPTYSAGGSMTFTSVTSSLVQYKIRDNQLFCELRATGTTGGTAANDLRATLPFNSSSASTGVYIGTGGSVKDTTQIAGYALVGNAGNLVIARKYDASNFGLDTDRRIEFLFNFAI